MNKLLFTSFIGLAAVWTAPLLAQRYAEFVFSDTTKYEVTEFLSSKPEAILDKVYSVEYVVDEKGEREYNFLKTVKLVNSDEAIESNNKIYLSSNTGTEYLFQKARVINPSGTVVELQQKDIQEGTFESDGRERKFNYYALEGLEKGSIIEEASYRVSSPEYYGKLIYMQGNEYRLSQTFELIAPNHLGFVFKSLNGANEIEVDTAATEVNRWYTQIDSLDGIQDQTYLYPDVSKQSILYKLERNAARNKSDITNYGNVSAYFFERMNPEITKKQQKEIDKLKGKIDLKGKSKEAQLLAVENHLKTNLNIIASNDKQFESLDFIFANKAANGWGVGILMLNILKPEDIKHQIVITTGRSELRFDPKFEAYIYLDKMLLYFPEMKLFIAPGEQFARGKYIPDTWSNNYGLFIREVKVGDLSTAVGKIDFIQPLPYEANSDIMDITADFTADPRKPEIHFVKSQLGYPAQYTQPFIYLLDEEGMGNLRNTLPDQINEEIETDNLEIKNTEAGDFGTKPFEMSFSTTEHRFVEDAGQDILFKVGELIGPQMELYQKTERQFPVESDFKRYYERTIVMKLPDHLEFKNPEALELSRYHTAGADTTMMFSSTWSRDGDVYTVKSREYYNRIVMPVEDYEAFTNVVNAAADFNKIVLIIKEK